MNLKKQSRWSNGIWCIAAACTLTIPAALQAQPQLAPPPGLRDGTPKTYALVGARIVVAPGQVIPQGTLIIRNGVIVAVGEDIAAPPDAAVRDLAGKTIYAGFIDAYSELSAPAPKGGGYWNPEVRPQVLAAIHFTPENSVNQAYRSQGVTARLLAPKDGIIRGVSAVVTTGKSNAVLRDQVALHVSLMPDRRDREHYPGSPMGAVALVRQALYDAAWYAQASEIYAQNNQPLARPEHSETLKALLPYATGNKPVVFEAPNELYALRAARVAEEFNLKFSVRGSGREYRRLEAIAQAGCPIIVPLNFPKAPYVKTPEAALAASLEQLQHWDHAPENPARLAAAGVKIAFTGQGLPKDAKFLDRVRQAVRRGLPADRALAALTVDAAAMLGVDQQLGTLEAGKAAHLVVASGDLFDSKTKLLQTWVDGEPFEIEEPPAIDVRGVWKLRFPQGEQPVEAVLTLAGTPQKLTGNVKSGNAQTEILDVVAERFMVSGRFAGSVLGKAGQVQFSGVIVPQDGEPPTLVGTLYWSDGTNTLAQATRTEASPEQVAQTASGNGNGNGNRAPPADDDSPVEAPPVAALADDNPVAALFPINYPLGAYGRAKPPELPELVAFKNATIWTSGPQGVITDGTLIVEKGRILSVGPSSEIQIPPQALVVDCRGKHLTPGMIDCHSHIASDGGINESTQSITAEVRIGDFIDPNDVNIYRQLAGGVTSSNILHGSANTIGGQNQVIKMRWGALPEEMKFLEAPQGIKFALGENVKQSNWGDNYRTRYPQSRMGVEQLVRDAFEAAGEYRRRQLAWRQKPAGLPPRVDLELEALAEVLEGTRLIHCHSYRQDEILALLRTCEAYGVRIGTLQHILEGYKVADQIARHGAGASSFSDWWAYKYEVWDAIPYNGALLHKQGVVVSFNSDDAELARRLNGEAAKAVKYGDVDPEQALKFVTLNPAKQLGIDRHVGSLEPGKHADLVVWNGPPLSPLSVCQQTWIDGRKYFDREEDLAARSQVQSMRAALVQRILGSKAPMANLEEETADPASLWPRTDLFCTGHCGQQQTR